MDKAKLEQYTALKREIELLDEQAQEAERQLSQFTVSDCVKGSDDGFPFNYHSISMHGVPKTLETDKIREALFSIRVKRRERLVEAVTAINEIETFIDSIDDSLTRQIFTLRCIKGYTWARIAVEVGGGNGESGVKMIYHRYLGKCKAV